MENVYTAYIKEVNNQQLYFVKKFTSFPELENVDPILDSLGMHRDFNRACEMAQIYNKDIIKDLYSQLHIVPESKNAIEPVESNSFFGALYKNMHHALVRMRIAGL
jgi:hypothetical protein